MLDGTYCLEIRNTPSQSAPDVDVIFVHGLSSGAQSAWENQNNDLWPMWLGQMLPQARILLLNYPAAALFTGDSSRINIQERARNLANLLPANGIGSRQTIFVCHSLGGIMVKEILRASIENGCSPRIAANTAGIIFLATPHLGSDLANFGSLFGSKLTKDLARGSDYLKDLHQWFST